MNLFFFNLFLIIYPRILIDFLIKTKLGNIILIITLVIGIISIIFNFLNKKKADKTDLNK